MNHLVMITYALQINIFKLLIAFHSSSYTEINSHLEIEIHKVYFLGRLFENRS